VVSNNPTNAASWQIANNAVWTDWVYETTTSITNQTVWTTWTNAGTATYTNTNPGWINVEPSRERTPEEVEAARVAGEERAAARARRQEADVARAAKARELLASCLDEHQSAEFALRGQFHVTARSGRRYCIKQGRAGNVTSPDTQGHTINYCIHDLVGLPAEDTMLAQKLMIELEEEDFLRIANASIRGYPVPAMAA